MEQRFCLAASFNHQTDVPLADLDCCQIRYDDGFVAYVDGQTVAAANALRSLAVGFGRYDGSAKTNRMVNDLTSLCFGSDFEAGSHVLAVHGVNAANDQDDFLLDIKLTGVQPADEVPAY
ncbi:MAG: hypothetical protein R3C28_04185 [Pirellulaceae bacterium]